MSGRKHLVPSECTDLLLGQVIRKVGNHDLGLGRDSVRRRAALPTLARGAGLRLVTFGALVLVSVRLVGDVLQSLNLFGSRGISSSSALGGSALLRLLILYNC